LAKEDFDKASALAEGEAHVLLDQARLAAAQADIPWLKLRLLPAGSNDEIRTTKAQLDERVSRARRASDEALAIAPLDAAAVRTKIDALRLAGERDVARGYVAKVIGQASQPETAYVLAALDLAEPDPLWTTVIERLRFAAAGEGNAGRARAALVYALAKSGDAAGAKAELAKLDALVRPYPLLPNLSALLEKAQAAKPALDAGTAASSAPHAEAPAGPGQVPPAAAATPPTAPVAASNAGGGGDSPPGDPRLGMQAAAQAERKGDWDRARQIYDGIVARNPSDSEALCGLGDVARARGDSAGAIAHYKRAIAVNPSYLPALLGVADTEWIAGDHGGAARAYKDIIDRFPEGTYPGYVKQRIEGQQAAPAASPSAPTTGARAPATNHAAPSDSPGEPSE
jgi:tetratricopeptide (TPR) repeat protein